MTVQVFPFQGPGDSPIRTTGYETSRYYSSIQLGDTTTLAVTADRLYGFLFPVFSKTTFTRVGIEVTTAGAASTLGRLGIYSFDMSNLSSSSLLLDAGTVATDSTGEKEATISQVLSPGFHILAAVFDGTPTVRAGFPNSGWHWQFLGQGTVADGKSVGDTLFHTSHTFGALPDPFGTPTYVARGANNPTIWMRVV